MEQLLQFGVLGALSLYLVKTLVEDLRADIRALNKTLMDVGMQSIKKGDELSTELREIKEGIAYLCQEKRRSS